MIHHQNADACMVLVIKRRKLKAGLKVAMRIEDLELKK
jgi:hypothetical protein